MAVLGLLVHFTADSIESKVATAKENREIKAIHSFKAFSGELVESEAGLQEEKAGIIHPLLSFNEGINRGKR